MPPNPDAAIVRFCDLIEDLPPEAKELWARCRSRVMDIGFESGHGPHGFHATIEASTIQRLATLEISVTITIYPIC